MGVRAVGGAVSVAIRRNPMGRWQWTVPAPKGHPRPPALVSLTGSAQAMAQALEDGLARLREVYTVPEEGNYCSPTHAQPVFPGAAGCGRCDDIKRRRAVEAAGDWSLGLPVMIVCRVCGNKRCPKAADHMLVCTGSNAPNQPGSSYQVCACTYASMEDRLLGAPAVVNPACTIHVDTKPADM